MATPRYLSGTNGFIPEASGQAIAYVRDPGRFKILQYAQTIKCNKPIIYYAFLDPDQAVRVVSSQEFLWPDGQYRPQPQANLANFKWEEVRVDRYNYGYTVGQQAVETAEGWNPKAFFNAVILSLAMTEVTFRMVNLMENTSNWGGNTSTVASLTGQPGARWNLASDDENSPFFLTIKKSINRAVRRVLRASNGMVQRKDLQLVIDPELADAISETSEIHKFIEGSPHALAQVKGDAPNFNEDWSLPEKLYGLPLIVEDATRCEIRANADGTVATIPTDKDFIKSRTSAAIVSRVGGVEGSYGSTPASTLQRYYYQYEMAVEAFFRERHKLWETHVVDQGKEVLPAPQTGFLITETMDAA